MRELMKPEAFDQRGDALGEPVSRVLTAVEPYALDEQIKSLAALLDIALTARQVRQSRVLRIGSEWN